MKNAKNFNCKSPDILAIKHNANSGFTLIEVMIAIMIFAVISVISYRTLSSLIATRDVITNAQKKWGGISKAINEMSNYCNRIIPLTILDTNGGTLPSITGKYKISGDYDSQLEMTVSGYIGDLAYGSTPPKRVGFRFTEGNLFLVIWESLNRAPNTRPTIIPLATGIKEFYFQYLNTDQQWYYNWPLTATDYVTLPLAIKVYIKLDSGEEITRQWAVQ